MLAEEVGGEVHGDGNTLISDVGSLTGGSTGQITFLNKDSFASQLSSTAASAVILKAKYADDCPVAAIVVDDPYLAYARIATLIKAVDRPAGQIHASAIVSENAHVDSSAFIGPNVTIADGVRIAAGVVVQAGCSIAENVAIGADSILFPRVTIYPDVVIGDRVRIHSGAVIGADGFGFARDGETWVPIPQVGSVQVGDDSDIGANSTVDRGAIEDTIIGRNVIIDNQVQIGHNVKLGDHTAIAACTGVAGSTVIGRSCIIGGHVGINGHIEICDNVFLSGYSMVTKSITEPGAYGSGIPVEPVKEWRRGVARYRALSKLETRVKALESQVDTR